MPLIDTTKTEAANSDEEGEEEQEQERQKQPPANSEQLQSSLRQEQQEQQHPQRTGTGTTTKFQTLHIQSPKPVAPSATDPRPAPLTLYGPGVHPASPSRSRMRASDTHARNGHAMSPGGPVVRGGVPLHVTHGEWTRSVCPCCVDLTLTGSGCSIVSKFFGLRLCETGSEASIKSPPKRVQKFGAVHVLCPSPAGPFDVLQIAALHLLHCI